MKKKRYFCDWCNQTSACVIILIALVLIFVVASSFFYVIAKHNNAERKNEYCEEVYQYLEHIADMVISEEGQLDVNQIPEDVYEYSIIYENGNIKFEYSLDNTKWKTGEIRASMTIIMTKDMEVLKKSSNYASSKEEYESMQEIATIVTSLMGGGSAAILIVTLAIVVGVFAFIVSYKRKEKDQSKIS